MTPVTAEIYRFRFTPDVPMERARDLVAHAILLAQQIHGPARVRLDCGYWADDSKPRPQDTERIQWLLLRCQKLNPSPTMLLLISDVEDVYEDEVGAIGSIG